MAAANTDLVRLTTPNFATTLANSMLSADTSMTMQSATGLSTQTAVTLVIDATDPVSGVATPNLKEVVTGTLAGNVLSNLLRGQDGTTQQSHAAGANVVMWWNANMINDFMNAFLAQHKQSGAHFGLTTDTINATGNATVGGSLGVTGPTTLTGAVGGPGFAATTFSNPYKFSAYLNTNQTISGGAWTKVNLNTKQFDTTSNFDAVTNFQFTAPVAGFYFFSGGVTMGTNADGQLQSVGLNVGSFSSSPTYQGGQEVAGGVRTGAVNLTVAALIQLAANQTVQLYGFSDFTTFIGSSLIQTYLTGFLVSAT